MGTLWLSLGTQVRWQAYRKAIREVLDRRIYATKAHTTCNAINIGSGSAGIGFPFASHSVIRDTESDLLLGFCSQ